MNKTCPNCGAPISGWECNYCGAVFYDFSNLDISFDKPIFMRFKHEGKVVETKVVLTRFDVNSSPEYSNLYCNNDVYSCMAQVRTEIDMSFDVIDDILVKEKRDGSKCRGNG